MVTFLPELLFCSVGLFKLIGKGGDKDTVIGLTHHCFLDQGFAIFMVGLVPINKGPVIFCDLLGHAAHTSSPRILDQIFDLWIIPVMPIIPKYPFLLLLPSDIKVRYDRPEPSNRR